MLRGGACCRLEAGRRPAFYALRQGRFARKAHPEYPRPQMVRDEWQNLNGLWDYAIRPRDDAQPKQFDGKILVPFPVSRPLRRDADASVPRNGCGIAAR